MAGKTVTLEGRNTIHDALVSGKHLVSVVISQAALNDPRIREIEALATKNKVYIEKISPRQFQHASQGSAQGVIAQVELSEPPDIDTILARPKPFLLFFNRLDYEQNLGAILRSAWAAAVDAIIVGSSGVHEVTPVVAKVSQGGAVHIPLIATSLFPILTQVKAAAIPVVGVEVGLGQDYTRQDLTGPIALVFGGEAVGLSEPLKKYCDFFIHIPMAQNVASLNVSVAAALVMFEKNRQERS